MSTRADHPHVLLPPPLLYLGAFAAAWALHARWPAPLFAHAAVFWTGAALLVLGMALNFWGAYGMLRARTPINPYRPVSGIVARGAFRISRNPLYVGLDLTLAGALAMLGSAWGVPALALVLLVMHYGVILREERYLEGRFGERYRRYRAAVRRYL
jgi:protein-S-isoprenylcysteine O-methyltransferase Ste14